MAYVEHNPTPAWKERYECYIAECKLLKYEARNLIVQNPGIEVPAELKQKFYTYSRNGSGHPPLPRPMEVWTPEDESWRWRQGIKWSPAKDEFGHLITMFPLPNEC